ncbi:hypothetical protein B0A48_13875 [Cryoendolithus antarcticus]|uniref:mRNA 3'-end-processing protein n=1 Tax=Cryoendolithus antarcticus TaxID=1507870 RepID=A0A1V8SMY0_9PEZI|nr:hypothetical protein B0A48_13875 [Cryoendolithus antarcticus]
MATTTSTMTKPPTLPEQILHPTLLQIPAFTFLPSLLTTHPTLSRPSKLSRPICAAYKSSSGCPRGPLCPDRHYTPPSERAGVGNLICKHYQRGLCKKGDACDFAHTFNLRDERECKEFSRWGVCGQGEECAYLHIGPNSPLRRKACEHYARGFCPLGPWCKQRHVKHKVPCPFYLAGFCPNGRAHPPGPDRVVSCEYGAHARWIRDEDLVPRKPEVRTAEDEAREQKEQEEREVEFWEESERMFERDMARGGQFGSRGGFRGRGRGRGGFRGKRF